MNHFFMETNRLHSLYHLVLLFFFFFKYGRPNFTSSNMVDYRLHYMTQPENWQDGRVWLS